MAGNLVDPHSQKVDEITKEQAEKRGRIATAEAIKQFKAFGEMRITPEMYESGAVIRVNIPLSITKNERL